jgi:hypothetical protein
MKGTKPYEVLRARFLELNVIGNDADDIRLLLQILCKRGSRGHESIVAGFGRLVLTKLLVDECGIVETLRLFFVRHFIGIAKESRECISV